MLDLVFKLTREYARIGSLRVVNTSTTSINRARVTGEEPVELAQYIRENNPSYRPYCLEQFSRSLASCR